MLVKERGTRTLLRAFSRELQMHTYYTFDEDIMTGKVSKRRLHDLKFSIENRRSI